MTDVRVLKKNLREFYKEKRKSLSIEERKSKDEKICKNIMSLCSYRFADACLGYAALQGEADITNVLNNVIKQGKTLALPRCTDRENSLMSFFVVKSFDDLEKGSYGISEPKTDLPIYEKNSDRSICLIPAIAFDKKGHRLGYGKGYYDRYLRDYKGLKVGVVYDGFIDDDIPCGRYDLVCDIIVTDKGVIKVAKD